VKRKTIKVSLVASETLDAHAGVVASIHLLLMGRVREVRREERMEGGISRLGRSLHSILSFAFSSFSSLHPILPSTYLVHGPVAAADQVHRGHGVH